ncbi:unnamed protein product, partial [Oikopleura dioica]
EVIRRQKINRASAAIRRSIIAFLNTV